MYYITVKQPPMYHQMTLEEFLFGTNVDNQLINKNLTNTKTYEFENISKRFLEQNISDRNRDVNYIMNSIFQRKAVD